MFDWNDLRHFLAVARTGSTLAAAKALGTSQSTVHRRLTELEAQIGRLLVTRHPTGYRLTELGEHLLPHAERAEEAMTAFERNSLACDTVLAGTIRVTCAPSVADRLTKSQLIDAFHARYPGLRVELVITDRLLDLSKGQADIAIRHGEPGDEALVGRKIAEVPWAVYASRSYVERHGSLESMEDVRHHLVITCDGEIANFAAARWLRSVAPHATVAARSDNWPGYVSAVKSGVGLGPLPIHIGQRERELVPLIAVPELVTHFRLLVHRDLQRTPRVRAFLDFVAAENKVFRALLLQQAEPANVEVETTILDRS